MTETDEQRIGEFLVARGGPFYALQRQLGLLRDDAFRAGSRAALFVGLAWGVPLLLCIFSGTAFGPAEMHPFLLEPGIWARFFIAVGLFMLMERQVEERLRRHLRQFVRAPLLAPNAFESAARAVTGALERRNNGLAEAVCLALAIGASAVTVYNAFDAQTSTWAVTVSAEGKALTVAGWWCALISSPIFWFLLLRWLWRHLVWALLLRELARLDLRLVATHPDGLGGLAFVGQYPNAYSSLVFAVSCVLGAAVANEFAGGGLALSVYGALMTAWLVIVYLHFALPLFAFRKPLIDLKQRTLLICSAQATRHLRAAERETLGRNMSAEEDAESATAGEIPDSSKIFATASKLSVNLLTRSALLPLSAAAIAPLVAAGATQLPIKELLSIVKRLLIF